MCFNSQTNFLCEKIVFLFPSEIMTFTFSFFKHAAVPAPELGHFKTTIKKC